MKVAFLIPTLTAGGAERVLTRMANYWSERSDNVSIITLDDPHTLPFYPLHQDIRLTQLNLALAQRTGLKKINGLRRQIIGIRKYVVSEKPDVLIAFLDIAIFLSLVATAFLPVKVIISERNNPYRNHTNPWLQRMNNRLYSRADRIVLQTQRIAQTFPKALQSAIRVVGNPVKTPKREVKDYATQHQRRVILAVGRLAAQKGFDVLVQAFARLLPQHPDWQLRIVGVGEEEAALKQRCADLSIAESVTFLGSVAQVEDKLLAASMFVLSSRFEGFPNALCEAMVIGLPVVATRCEFGPEEIIRHEENGLLVPVDDAQELSDAMQRLVEDPALGQRLGTQAKEIRDTYSIDTVMTQWKSVVQSMIEPSPS